MENNFERKFKRLVLCGKILKGKLYNLNRVTSDIAVLFN